MSKTMSKKALKELKEQLFHRPKLVWDEISEAEKKQAWELGDRYKTFLTRAKTEREAVREIVSFAKSRGFVELGQAKKGARKIYAVNKRKSVILAVLGTNGFERGLRIVGSHIDCPRLDLKQNPLYEAVDLAYFKTHYYGGIKKYQWVARPLALHGKVILKGGKELDLAIGEQDNDPVFIINDLLPHLGKKAQYEKKLPEIVEGEKLNLLIGGLPFPAQEAEERFKLAVLSHLHETYGITEADLITAELEAVPAGPARDIGLDRSMVGGFGQDDRNSAFTSLEAIGAVENPNHACLAVFMDKEEVGSEGATGAKSRFLETVLSDLFEFYGKEVRQADIRKTLFSAKALSADVNPAVDADWQEVFEKRNSCFMGYGICLTKFTGSGGKVGASDANAEYLAWFREVMDKAGVLWQTGELGKVDEGGGGTIAKFMAEYGMEVVDVGAPVLTMHSPFEVSHKADVYMTYRCFKAFFEAE